MGDLASPSALAYERALLPLPSTPWREASFTVLDLELTGLDPNAHEIVSFATVSVAEGCVRLADARYRVVRPRRMPDGETIRIHGLRAGDLADAPPLSEVLDELLEALTGTTLVAHAAAVEEAFLEVALGSHGLSLRNPIVDTAALSSELRRHRRLPPLRRGPPGPADRVSSSPGLTELARSLGLPSHRPHHADGDALTTAQVFIALATHLDAVEPQTVGSLGAARRRAGPGTELLRALRRRLRSRPSRPAAPAA
jgi:DNA polymerase-3 subunit epsilon